MIYLCHHKSVDCWLWDTNTLVRDISRISCQKGPTRHAYAWQIGPFWQDTLDICLYSCNSHTVNERKRLHNSIHKTECSFIYIYIYICIWLGLYIFVLLAQIQKWIGWEFLNSSSILIRLLLIHPRPVLQLKVDTWESAALLLYQLVWWSIYINETFLNDFLTICFMEHISTYSTVFRPHTTPPIRVEFTGI